METTGIGVRATMGRALALLAACGLLLASAPVASAAEEAKVHFEYGKDRKAWFWRHQQDQEVTTPVDPPPPVPALSHRQRVPTPHIKGDTLPVAVYRGEEEMVSALYFDLSTRGVTLGSEITKFELRIEEGSERSEQPPVNPDEASIEACRATEFWPAADDAQEWETQPAIDETECVEGKRRAKGQRDPVWTFDLTDLAEPWGEDPFDNHGVLLRSVVPDGAGPRDNWHVNLKIPSRDDGETEENEYRQTRGRAVVDLAFVPGEPEIPPAPPATTPTFPTTGGSFGGTGNFFTPATDFGSTDVAFGDPIADAAPPAEQVGAPEAAPVAATQPQQPAPALPGYVWALLPLGLLALGAVRSVVLEPTRGTRPDGVIAAIQRRNAERRGAPIRTTTDPFAAVLSRGRQALSGTGAAISRTASRVLRSVRRR